MGWRRPSQPLKSPTTETRRAFGAQTRNAMPATPSSSIGMGAELLVQPQMIALGDQIDVQLAEDRREAVGIVDLDGVAARRPPGAADRRLRVRSASPTNSPSACSRDSSPAARPEPASISHTRAGVRLESAHHQRRRHRLRGGRARRRDRRDRRAPAPRSRRIERSLPRLSPGHRAAPPGPTGWSRP